MESLLIRVLKWLPWPLVFAAPDDFHGFNGIPWNSMESQDSSSTHRCAQIHCRINVPLDQKSQNGRGNSLEFQGIPRNSSSNSHCFHVHPANPVHTCAHPFLQKLSKSLLKGLSFFQEYSRNKVLKRHDGEQYFSRI